MKPTLEQRIRRIEERILKEENHDLEVQVIRSPEFQELKRKRFSFQIDYGYSDLFSFTAKHRLDHGVNISPTFLVFNFSISDDEDSGFLSITREDDRGHQLRDVDDYPDLNRTFTRDFTELNSYREVLKAILNYYKRYLI